MTPEAVYVFGNHGGVGHHIFIASRHRAGGTTVPYDVERACDGIGSSFQAEPEGVVVNRASRQQAWPIPAGWSFVSWWDRQGDQRGGSHTGILAKGEWTAAQLIEAGRRLAPWAFRVEVRS